MGTNANRSSTNAAPTILVVEDDEDLANLYASWLSETYTVTTAETGEEALEKLSPDIDIVLLDRRLPGMSGDEVLNQINETYPGLPVAIVSAIRPGLGVIDMGLDDYLVKPVEKAELLELLKEMLGRSTDPAIARELQRLEAKKTTLEAAMSSSELARQDRYQELKERIEELQAESG